MEGYLRVLPDPTNAKLAITHHASKGLKTAVTGLTTALKGHFVKLPFLVDRLVSYFTV